MAYPRHFRLEQLRGDEWILAQDWGKTVSGTWKSFSAIWLTPSVLIEGHVNLSDRHCANGCSGVIGKTELEVLFSSRSS